MFSFNHIKVGYKLSFIIAVAVIGFLILLYSADRTLEKNLLQEKEQHLTAVVSTVITQLQHLDQALPRDEAQTQAKSLIQAIRYGTQNNYVFVIDKDDHIIVHGENPSLVGKKIGQATHSDPYWQRIISVGRKPQGGTIRYDYVSQSGVTTPKLSFVNHYAPWGWVIGTGMLIQTIEQELNHQRWLMLLKVFGIIVVMGIMGYWISRMILTQLHHIETVMQRVVEGDLTQEVNVISHDELGKMGQQINRSLAAIRQALSESVTSANLLSETATRIAKHAETNNKTVIRQGDQMTQVVTAMHEMTTTVHEVATHAETAAQDTQHATQQSHQGHEYVQTTVSHIHALSEKLDLSSQQVESLKEGVLSINQITSVIHDIADQTNLLALNAAIEAARAGEQGRGFAVVAEEVRGLATRTSESTSQIHQTIKRLQDLAIASNETMRQSQESAHEGVTSAEESGQQLQTIVGHIQQISDKTIQIATAAEEQAAVAEEINQTITAVNDEAAQITESSNQLAQESEILADMSHHLRKTLQRFQLEVRS